jgi:hypothetical protein
LIRTKVSQGLNRPLREDEILLKVWLIFAKTTGRKRGKALHLWEELRLPDLGQRIKFFRQEASDRASSIASPGASPNSAGEQVRQRV